MKETLEIKEASGDDRAFIINGLVALQSHEASLHDTRKKGDVSLCQSYLEEIYTRARTDNGALLVAHINNFPVGFICFWIENDFSFVETEDSNRFGYISDIYVVEQHRGKVFARHMLEEAKTRLMKDPSIKRLRICSLAANSLAVSAYENAGFHRYEVVYEKLLR